MVVLTMVSVGCVGGGGVFRSLLKKSGCRTPRIELEEIGPSLDLVMRRTHLASDDLYKLAHRQPKALKVSHMTRPQPPFPHCIPLPSPSFLPSSPFFPAMFLYPLQLSSSLPFLSLFLSFTSTLSPHLFYYSHFHLRLVHTAATFYC